MILECCNLSKKFGRKQAVKDLSLTLEKGKILGIIGPNGAGKSTLIKMITGLIWPDKGYVKLNGYEVHKDHKKAMSKSGSIIEWPAFISYLSARQNLDILSGGYGDAYEKKLKDITEFVNLSGRLKDKVGTYSTGMKQRLGIALALLPDSEFIILDEPTNGLDPGGIIEIRRIIKEYNRQFGTTVIITSHMLGEIEQICHEIAIISDGSIITQGSIGELLHQEKTAVIACDNIPKAIELLNSAKIAGTLPIVNILDFASELHVEIDEDCLADMNAMLTSTGIKVSRLKLKQKKLEDFFMEKTAGGKPC